MIKVDLFFHTHRTTSGGVVIPTDRIQTGTGTRLGMIAPQTTPIPGDRRGDSTVIQYLS